MKLRAICVPLPFDLPVEALHGMTASYKPKLIVYDQPQYTGFKLEQGSNAILIPSFYANGKVRRNVLENLMLEGSLVRQPAVPDEPCIILSTSGSTSLPKGVMHSCGSPAGLVRPIPQARQIALLWSHPHQVFGTFKPLMHLIEGWQVIMVNTSPASAATMGALIDQHQINWVSLFGAMMNQFLIEFPGHSFSTVTKVEYAGSTFAPSLVQRCMTLFPNAGLQQNYGMTECFPMSSLAPVFHKQEAQGVDLKRMSSAGKPIVPVIELALGGLPLKALPNRGLFIEDQDEPGSRKPPKKDRDGVGQICTRSLRTMIGYYADPKRTESTMFDDQFVRTGDLGKIDEDGFLYIVGRVKDIIPTRSGRNVVPRDVEDALYANAAVEEVKVVGIRHPDGAGDAVVAWVHAKSYSNLNPAGLQGNLKSLAAYQKPDAIYISRKPLPKKSEKINQQMLASREFLQSQLAADALLARARFPCVATRAVKLDICSSGAKAIFGQHLKRFTCTKLGQAIQCMNDAEYTSFILGARSLTKI
jgi:acyl-CoA synthetase (AMP-forming)/AMP-acid ligase II